MLRNYSTLLVVFLISLLYLMTISCRKNEQINPDPSITLSFSTDTVFFDTVFPTIGSVTQRLIVYNTQKSRVSISKIFVAGGSGSGFRINVNGTPVVETTDIELSGNDSMFIFVRVTVDPQNQNIPFVVDDSIGFLLNGNQQYVKLVAWGRDAVFHRKAVLKGQVIWDSTRAHVVYESLRVDTNATLIIMPGTRVYFHKDAYLSVSSMATLKIPGSLDHPVRFQGDRLDPFYKDLPGQWGGVFLESGSKDHEFNYTFIRNGMFGLIVDSTGQNGLPKLILNNCIIQNVSYSGILAYGTSITSVNCVIGNCGGPALDINYGGSYDFRQLTIGNYWTYAVRNVPALYLSNYDYDTLGNKITNPLSNAYFGNLILYGANQEELMLDSVPEAAFNFQFDHAILKTTVKTTNNSRFVNCLINKDPKFTEPQKMNYQLDTLSPAIGQGKPLGIPFDIRGISRSDTPALGAYEYYKVE